jgi:hypothetical protein
MRLSKKQVNNHNNYVDRKIKNNTGNPAKPDFKYVPYKPKNVYRKQIIQNTGIPEKSKRSLDIDLGFIFDDELAYMVILVLVGFLVLYVLYAHISLSDIINLFKGLFAKP